MKHNSLLKALKKVGAEVKNTNNYSFTAEKDGKFVCWYATESYPDKTKLDATCVHTPSPHTDILTDCFCDRFYSTLKAAVAYLGDEKIFA